LDADFPYHEVARKDMAKKKARKVVQGRDRDRLPGRRQSRMPIVLLTLITAFASLALVVAGILNFGASR
jgi:hypothetical protein